MFTGLALNPAYAGSLEVLSLSALYRRSQWSGFERIPQTQTFAGDFPLRNPQLALGLLVVNDRVGIYRKTGIYGIYAYRVKAGKGKLSFGLQAGFDQLREDGTNIKTIQEGDPMFNDEIHKSFMPNVGAGIYYYTSKCFVGLSLPKLLAYSPHTADSYRGTLTMENAMLYGGGIIPTGNNFKIKPSVLLKYIQKSVLYDLNCNFIMFPEDRLEVGVSYRNANTLVAMAEIRVNSQMCIGYAYDHAFSNLNAANSCHEVMLRYEFRFRVKAENPLFLR
jgi:type IX secretion system PorP/SprF family membrane protein